MVNTDNPTTGFIPPASYPAVLIGGPPKAGKSVLTYHLTRELRKRNIPHFVFRASTDGEGDWYLSDEFDSAIIENSQQSREQIRKMRDQIRGQNKIGWFETFSETICPILVDRQLPLLVDVGGKPQDTDNCIFAACKYSILLLKDKDKEDRDATATWHHYTAKHGLEPIAELYSQLSKDRVQHLPTVKEPFLTGSIADLLREAPKPSRIGEPVFKELFDKVLSIFTQYTSEQMDVSHCTRSPIQPVINLEQKPYLVPRNPDKWYETDLPELLSLVPPQTPIAVYGRAPVWVYTALAMHAYPKPFHQFDACLNWVEPQRLQPLQQSTTSTSFFEKSSNDAEKVIELKLEPYDDAYIIRVRPIYYYLDYNKAEQLAFPMVPSDKGVIVDGKIPLWLYTSIARFYVDKQHTPWIAVNDASRNEPVVVYSRVPFHFIGETLPRLV